MLIFCESTDSHPYNIIANTDVRYLVSPDVYEVLLGSFQIIEIHIVQCSITYKYCIIILRPYSPAPADITITDLYPYCN